MMVAAHLYALPDRGVIAVTGADALPWLDNLVSADLNSLATKPLIFSGLLSPQGKVLFEFFVTKSADGLLLETEHTALEGLMKRIRLYKLRAKIDLTDVTEGWIVAWSTSETAGPANTQLADDPRVSRRQLFRALIATSVGASLSEGPYRAERVRLGIAEAPDDYALGDVFPHEANYDFSGGASFTKGCYVGQEVVSRMQNKTVVRKRVVRVSASGTMTTGADVTAGAAVIGKIGSVAGTVALAMLRLDRAAEAIDAGTPVLAGAQPISIDSDAIARYRQSVADRPVIDL